jgi:hypothetical protein
VPDRGGKSTVKREVMKVLDTTVISNAQSTGASYYSATSQLGTDQTALAKAQATVVSDQANVAQTGSSYVSALQALAAAANAEIAAVNPPATGSGSAS